MEERLTIVGSGAIACGVAAVAARHGKLALWARSETSAERARDRIHRQCSSLEGDVNPAHVEIHTDLSAALEGATFIVLLIGTVVLVGALTFLPALAVGPIVEHYLMGAGTLF